MAVLQTPWYDKAVEAHEPIWIEFDRFADRLNPYSLADLYR